MTPFITITRLLKKGSPEGLSPFGGGLGVSPRCHFHPLPVQEGGRGMVEKGFSTLCITYNDLRHLEGLKRYGKGL
ncbi:MAG: hypothetical protein HW388_1729 [Dehalococcoidia bacterium]|nr:hypothetical protein [Dehalococcoidia bacterium]